MTGKTISHYKILEQLGQGGMGVVYKAEDTKLDRLVALKFLPPHLAASDQDKARFIQEAKAASAINHPNICTIYSVDEHEGTLFIVMEFVDGQTLRDKKGTINFKQAIDIGIQIADGLAAAHEKGIVHRDIKPENIMIRKDGIVQIMDFGLAKLRASGSRITRLTKEGSTVGTAGYMSPEQVQGHDSDHRSDIFSYGVLLYELLTGQLPFKGVHETALAYEIVNVDPAPMSVVKPEIDPSLDAIVLQCLEKDPRERNQSVAQIGLDLKRYRRESSRQKMSRITAARPVMRDSSAERSGGGETATQDSAAKRSVPWLISALIAMAAALAGFGLSQFFRPGTSPQAVIRASVEIPHSILYSGSLGGSTALSPDGSMIVFAGEDSLSQTGLWVRPLNATDLRALPGTANATYPFWSPNNKSIGFFADGKVKIVEAAGGPVLTLADAPFGRGAAWSKNGEILFAPTVADPNLYAVSAAGGTPRRVTAFDTTSKTAPRFPFFLPDGDHFVYSLLTVAGASSNADVHVGSLGSVATKEILKGASCPMYASGHLLFFRQGILMAQEFDPSTLSLSGNPVPLQGNINAWPLRAKADYSVSETGTLIFSRGAISRENDFVWIDPRGEETPIFQTGFFETASLSPDGSRVAYDAVDEQSSKTILLVYNITSKAKMRLSFSENGVSRPVWSRDGEIIYYNAEVGASKANIVAKRSDGSGEERVIVKEEASAEVGYYPNDISPDGRILLVSVLNESKAGLGTVDLQEKVTPSQVKMLGITGSYGRFSPDGKWIVYVSNETGTNKVYVSSFGGSPGKWQLSAEGATTPLWQSDKITYYEVATNRYLGVDVSFVSGAPSFSEAKPVFPPGKTQRTIITGVTADGKKYLGIDPAGSGTSAGLSLVVNWQGLIERK